MKAASFTFVFFIGVSNTCIASSITSTSSVGFQQSIGQTNGETSDSTVNTTSIIPNYTLKYSNRKLSADLDYSLFLISDNANKDTFTNQTLNLKSNYVHIKNSWNSQLSTQIIQKNATETDLLTPIDVTTSSNTRDYVISSISTNRIYNISKKTQLTSTLSASEQGFKSASKQGEISLDLGFKATQFTPSFSFNSTLNSSHSNDSNNEVSNALTLTLDYKINYKLSSYLTNTAYSGTNEQLNKSRTAIGINWNISSNSQFAIDVGQFGNDSSWSANSNIQLRRTSFQITHSEKISRPNQTLLENLNNSQANLTDSISNTLSLNKLSSINISHKLRRMSLNFSLSNSQTFSDFSSSANRTAEGFNFSLNYILSKLTTVTYAFSNNTITSTEKNQLLNYSVNWVTKANRRSSYNVKLSVTDQTSSQLGFDYINNQIDINYRLTF